MTKHLERRMSRALAATNEAMRRSDLVIWCFEPGDMPAMIDLLIAQGRLTEADRPHCIHSSALGDLTDEHVGKTADAEEMLAAAGIRTLAGDAWAALTHSAAATDAFLRERCADRDPEEIEGIRKLGEEVRHQPEGDVR
jgi:hypothetical protein